MMNMNDADAKLFNKLNELMPTIAAVITVGIIAQMGHSLLEERDALGNPKW